MPDQGKQKDKTLRTLCSYNLMQKHLRHKKVRPSKVESYLEVNT